MRFDAAARVAGQGWYRVQGDTAKQARSRLAHFLDASGVGYSKIESFRVVRVAEAGQELVETAVPTVVEWHSWIAAYRAVGV